MSRLIFFLFLLLAGRWFWRLTCTARTMHAASTAKRKASYGRQATHRGSSSEQMVCCVECNTYVPIGEARYVANQSFRCREHAHPFTRPFSKPRSKEF